MVSSYTQLLERRYRGKLDADADEFIGYAVDGAARMQDLINDLLAYSRVGTPGKATEPTDSNRVFNQVIASLKATIEDNGAVVTHKTLPTVMAEESELVHLFQNLVVNAIKFHGEEQPRVHASAEHNEKDWVFSVRGQRYRNRAGVLRSHLRRLSTPAYQGQVSRDRYRSGHLAKGSWRVTAAASGWSLSWGRARSFTSRFRRRRICNHEHTILWTTCKHTIGGGQPRRCTLDPGSAEGQ